MTVNLTDKRMIVTGAAGAVGSAAVRLFAEQGAVVLAVDNDAAGLQAIDEARLPRVRTHRADVGSASCTAGYVARALELFGGVDLFFNNAAVEAAGGSTDDDLAENVDWVVSTNLRGLFLGLTHVLPVMSEGGSVVNTASSTGLVRAATVSPYVIGLTKSTALEVADRGIRVNAICPGPVAGRVTEQRESAVFGVCGTTFVSCRPVNRYGGPEEIAALVAYLFSDQVPAPTQPRQPTRAQRPEDLTDRETEVLELLSRYMSNAEIARTSFVSLDTVKYHLKNIYAKLGAKDRVDALRIAHEMGYGAASRSPTVAS